MSKAAGVQPYRWLAEHFDLVFAGYRRFIEAAHHAIVWPILPQVRVACDLACGTGTTALDLAARGIRMYGVDLSPSMCRAARRKARERKLALRVIQADMRDFRLPEPVDLILSEYDAINHVPRHSDLRRVCAAVERVLNPGGWFFFDVNNLAGTNPKFSYDPTGVAVTGRYTVRFNSDWSQSVTPGRSEVQIELIELA